MKIFTLLLASSVVLTAAAQTQLSDADLQNAYSKKSISRISVHDPSIFIEHSTATSEDPTYYIYGSHRAGGSTKGSLNYQKWTGASLNNNYTTNATKTVKNCNGEIVQFGNFDAHDWQAKGNSVSGMEWAPDIIWNPTMNKYCMYMSVNGDSWCSSIVLLTSDSPKGPWTYQGPVVFSGFQGTYEHNGFSKTNDYKHTDLEIALGELSSLPARYKQGGSWGSYWPNCIDPCVFYDDEGKLWFSYGSWSGGIFMFELDETTGLRDYTVKYTSKFSTGSDYRNCVEDPYFGKKIAGGWYNSGEASYIQKIGKYYYLFMSYGGLSGYGDYFATGYQIRVFRSEKPDGPYVDCLTADGQVATFTSAFTDFGSNSKYDIGVRLMSCYKWDTMPFAEIAQGHNSAFVDHKNRAFVVYHTRETRGNEGHSVRVHQLFQNQDGWLVAAPYEFSGEEYTQADIDNKQLYSAEEVAGDYQLIFHKYRQRPDTQEHELPVTVTLHADGSVTGSCTGTWSLVPGTSYININLKSALTTSEVKFNGVLTRQTIDYTDIPALCFTAISSNDGATAKGAGASYVQTRGLCVWGSKADAKAAIKYTVDNMTVPVTVNKTLSLAKYAQLGTTVSFTSSDQSILTNQGAIAGSGTVNLDVCISKDGYEYHVVRQVTVDSQASAVYTPSAGNEDNSSAFWTSFSDYYRLKKGETAEFRFYNYNQGYGDNWCNWILATANAERGSSQYNEYFVLRNDAYGWDPYGGNTSNNFSYPYKIENNFNWSTFVSDMNGAAVDMFITYTNTNAVNVAATITTKAGQVFELTFNCDCDVFGDLIVFFTVEKSHMVGAESLGISDVFADEPLRTGEANYDIFGHKQYQVQRGLNVRNGKLIFVR